MEREHVWIARRCFLSKPLAREHPRRLPSFLSTRWRSISSRSPRVGERALRAAHNRAARLGSIELTMRRVEHVHPSLRARTDGGMGQAWMLLDASTARRRVGKKVTRIGLPRIPLAWLPLPLAGSLSFPVRLSLSLSLSPSRSVVLPLPWGWLEDPSPPGRGVEERRTRASTRCHAELAAPGTRGRMKGSGKDGLRGSILLLCFVLASSMMGMPEQKKAKAVKSDVQYIRCGVCEELARNVHRSVKSMREELRPGKKLSESQILDMLENVCNPEKEQGEWITMIDLVESGNLLKLERQDWPGKCGTECRTIARACEEIMGDRDTDLAEFLYNDALQRAQLNNLLCYEETDACTRKTPPLPKDRAPGPAFEEMTEQDLKMQKMMRDLGNVPGMPGMQMFSRDDLQKQMDEMEDAEDENEDLGLDGAYDMDEDVMMDDEPPPSLGETVTRGAKAIKDGVMSSFEKGKRWASQKLRSDTEL